MPVHLILPHMLRQPASAFVAYAQHRSLQNELASCQTLPGDPLQPCLVLFDSSVMSAGPKHDPYRSKLLGGNGPCMIRPAVQDTLLVEGLTQQEQADSQLELVRDGYERVIIRPLKAGTQRQGELVLLMLYPACLSPP